MDEEYLGPFHYPLMSATAVQIDFTSYKKVMKFLRQFGKIPRWGEGNGEPFTIFRSDQNLFKKYKNALRTDEHVVRESPHGTNNVTFFLSFSCLYLRFLYLHQGRVCQWPGNEEGSLSDSASNEVFDSSRGSKKGSDTGRGSKKGSDSGCGSKKGFSSGHVSKIGSISGRVSKKGSGSSHISKKGDDCYTPKSSVSSLLVSSVERSRTGTPRDYPGIRGISPLGASKELSLAKKKKKRPLKKNKGVILNL